MAPRLKVFQWSDGFHAFTVAASSRPKALAAWGVSQDLFASGLAREIAEGDDLAPALAKPGTVITRGLAVDVGRVEARSPSRRAGAKTGESAKTNKARVAAAKALAEARSALDREREAADAERAALDMRIRDLERARDAAARRWATARRRLERRVEDLRARRDAREP